MFLFLQVRELMFTSIIQDIHPWVSKHVFTCEREYIDGTAALCYHLEGLNCISYMCYQCICSTVIIRQDLISPMHVKIVLFLQVRSNIYPHPQRHTPTSVTIFFSVRENILMALQHCLIMYNGLIISYISYQCICSAVMI